MPAYSGSVSGEMTLPMIGADVLVRYDFGAEDVLTIDWRGCASAAYQIQTDTVVFQIADKSLGALLAEVVGFVENEPNFSLPAPWNLLNDISLKGFTVTWKLKPAAGENPISVSYDFQGNNINLYFVEISAFSLTSVAGKVQMGLTFKLITDTQFQTQTFDPRTPPTVPGNDTSKFELDLLALGQHVSVTGLDQVTPVDAAITLLESFAAPAKANSIPVQANPASGQPAYAADSLWLIGSRFKVLVDKNTKIALLDLQIVFNDPILYGLRVVLGGPKAGVLGGLDFEIMYRKVSDTIGIYQIELTLPDWARHLEFGEVSVTLPIVGVDVYTNGDFRIDFGFPANMDFSRSFGIQAFPFTGAGGFYFGVLSNATAPNLPTTTLGRFDPVIVFGIGLQLGLGKSIDEGIFSAQMTLTVFGILEGVVAPWHPYAATPELTDGAAASTDAAAFDDTYYYWLRGTIGIVATLVGEVNFAIISASVNVTAQAYVQLTIEAHKAIPIHMQAGVSVALTLRINLGLFSILIHLSFSLTITADFVIGSDSPAPWNPDQLATERRAALAAPDALELAVRAFPALAVQDKLPITIWAAPHLTLADWTTGTSPQAAYVLSLYLNGPIGLAADAPLSAFEILSSEALLWMLAEFGTAPPAQPADSTSASLSRAGVAAGTIGLTQAQNALKYFAAGGAAPPVDYCTIRTFLSSTFDITVRAPGADVASAVSLPIVPDLVLQVPACNGQQAQTIDFTSNTSCSPQYLSDVQDLLKQLAVNLETDLQRQQQPAKPLRSAPVSTQSLASFVFEDYFTLLGRHLLQATVDNFGSFSYQLQGSENLDAIIAAFDTGNVLTPARIAAANPNLPLAANAVLTVLGGTHPVLVGQSLTTIAAQYGSTALAVATANSDLQGLLVAGLPIQVGADPHVIGLRDSFASIAAASTGQLSDVVSALQDRTDALVPLAVLALPAFDHQVASGVETLTTVAAAYGISITALAQDNATVGPFFAAPPGKATFVAVTGLTVLTAAQLGSVLHDAQVYANLAGLSTRFVLNGLRLPVNANITLSPENPCAGQSSGGLQALLGQQLTLPPLADSDAGNYTLTFSGGAQGDYLQFAAGSALALPLDKAAIDQINAVLAAATPALLPDTTAVTALPATSSVARRFVLPTPIPLRLPTALALPHGPAAAAGTLFPLPDGLLSVLAEPAVAPAFSLQLGSPAPSGGMELTPAQSYGWASLVKLTLKRPAAGVGTPMSPGSYDLVGTDATGIVLLGRLLQAAGSGTSPVLTAQLYYQPNSAAPLSDGLQGADPATSSSFVVQANLSTATSPQGVSAMLRSELSQAPVNVAVDPTTFVRMLWECSIVQSGGYAIYYEAAPGNPGLPDHLFDASGRAELQLLVLHNDGTAGIGSYVNAAVIGDRLDPRQTTVLARSEPLAATLNPDQPQSPASLAAQLHLTPTEVAVALAQSPLLLGSGVQLQIAGGRYESRSGDTVGALASRFATSPAALEAMNPGLQIDWTSIPPWTLLQLPTTSYQLVNGAQFGTLAAVAETFSLSVAALGWLNQGVPMFGPATFILTDQLLDSAATLPAGVAGFSVTRQQKSGDPADPAVYLDTNFHLLGYQVIDNLNFTAGVVGLPITPVDPLTPEQLAASLREHAPPAPQNDAALLQYQQLLPVPARSRFNPLAGTGADVPDGSVNPYAGVGYCMQPKLEWRDLFGNRARTQLSDPSLDPTGPQNEPPVWIGYSDKLIGPAQWPSLSTSYQLGTDSGSAHVSITLSFDASRYAGAGAGGPARNAALTDRQTYAQIYYQLYQTQPDGTPHVSMAVSTSLDGGGTHPLSGTNLTAVQGLALSAWRYLDGLLNGGLLKGGLLKGGLLNGGAGQTTPITTSVTVPVQASNPADIFVLDVSLALLRQPGLVADESRDEDGVAAVTTVIAPLLGDWTETASLLTFAQTFETAFATPSGLLKLGVGDSRQGASGAAEARLLWAVRTSSDLSSGISAQLSGPPIFWAPPPLSTVPISRHDVSIWTLDKDGKLDPNVSIPRSYTNVDLDVWARQALAAIDEFLTPRYDIPTFVVDSRYQTSYLDRLRTAKASIASAIASRVQPVLTSPAVPDDPRCTTDAQATWEQQLLITLGSVYSVDVAVQLPVAVRFASDGSYDAPALYGHPVIPTSDSTVAPPYALSSFKVAANQPSSYLSFLFTANDPSDAAVTELDLTFGLDQIEHQIGPVAGITGYRASTWLSFPIPLPALTSTDSQLELITVPIVLRAYPESPALNAQSSSQKLDSTNARTLVESATEWTYLATYSEQHVAQDVSQLVATFNVADSGLRAGAQDEDVFDCLARLLALSSDLQAAFDSDLCQLSTASVGGSDQFNRAVNAVDAFTVLIEDLAASWPRESGSVRSLRGLAAVPTSQSLTFSVAESRYPNGTGVDLLVTVAELSTAPPGVPAPQLQFTGYQPVVTGTGLRYQASDGMFLSWEQARALAARTVGIGPMPVLQLQNAELAIRLVRNAELVAGNPTLPAFVYTTPYVSFASVYTPLLSVTDQIDVAAIGTGTPVAAGLASQLRSMFAAVFEADIGTQSIRVQTSYRYPMVSELPAGSLPDIEVPIAFTPSAAFDYPADCAPNGCQSPVDGAAPFVCRLEQVIRDWISSNQPTSAGSLGFDIAAYSTLNDATLPLLDIRGFNLRRQDITDL